MKKKQKYLYRTVELSYLLEYLMFSKNIQKDMTILEKRLIEPDFIGIVVITLQNISIKNDYPKECIHNLFYLVQFLKLKTNHELLEEAYTIFKNIKEYSYQIYQTNFCMKVNRIQDGIGNSFLAWKKESIEKSIRDDYENVKSLTDPLEYNNMAHTKVLSLNYLFTLKRILFSSPQLFLDSLIQQNALKVLNSNQKQLMDLETSLEIFNRKNYGIDIEENKKFLLTQLRNFQLDNNDLIRKISDYKKIKNSMPFDLYEFTIYKDQIMVDAILFGLIPLKEISNRKEDTVLLQNIYDLIEYNKDHQIHDDTAKDRLITILSIFREKLLKNGDCFLKEYNEKLRLLNEIEGRRKNLLDNLSILKLSFRKHLQMIEDHQLQQDLIDTIQMDYFVLRSYCLDDEEYEKRKKVLLNNEDYIYSIRRFLTEEALLFDDPIVLERTKDALKSYLKTKDISKELRKCAKKSLKRLEKYY